MTLSTPTFSAVVPAYNAEATLDAALRSVAGQTRSDFEAIVVDDGSTDRTHDVARRAAERDERIRVVRQSNRGLPAARNAGIAAARGRYVSFLDSDDLWMPRYLEAMAAALDASPQAGIAYTDAYVLDDRAHRIRRRTAMSSANPPEVPPADPADALRVLVERNFIVVAATVRRSVLAAVGGFDESLRAAEDYELWLRILAHGYGLVRPPGLLHVQRDRPGSMSDDPVRMYEALRQVWTLVADEHPAPDDVKQRARAQAQAAAHRAQLLRGRGLRSGLRRLRAATAPIRRRLLHRRVYYRQTPIEVARAFPWLEMR